MKPRYIAVIFAALVIGLLALYARTSVQSSPRQYYSIEIAPPAKASAGVSATPVPSAPVPTGPGSLKGIVLFDGEPPEMKDLNVKEAFQAQCDCKTVPNESLVVDKATKGIKWAMVRIMDVKNAPELKDPPQVSLSQPKCRFEPHVVIVAPGADLTLLNPDKIMHNVHTIPLDGNNMGKNNVMTNEKMMYKGKFLAEPEIIQVQCDIHGWMKAFIVVHDPRFAAITADDGKFEIKGLPPGKYKLSIFHESLGEKNIDVEIKPGAPTDLGDIKFKK